ncbi:MAG: FliI/YscN family ATPase [Phycisphaerales bacterium]|nr:FliI/YscN family ATPase [Phycisphaerales bacterium]
MNLRGSLEQSLEGLSQRLASGEQVARSGRVTSIIGPIIRATFPDARIGARFGIQRRDGSSLIAEAVGFDRTEVLLMPLGGIEGIAARAVVTAAEEAVLAPAGDALRGRVLDALGNPIDGAGPLVNAAMTPLEAAPPDPLKRRRITEPLETGVKAIDALLTVGRGQRVGIFAGSGVGKTTLLSAIARHVQADRIVLGLIGERGREVLGFLHDDLGPAGLDRCTVVVSTSDQPPLLRLKAAHTATAIAEHARAQGQNVVLLMDSVTRFARALRDVGLAAGEPPGRQGYPASVYAQLPRLFERAGNDDKGTMTAFYTVLVTGDDLTEPIADEAKALLDGHIVLARRLAQRKHWPAIDLTHSESRVRGDVVTPAHRSAAERVLGVIADYESNYDKISLGLYQHPKDSRHPDPAVLYPRRIEPFLRQDLRGERPGFEASVAELMKLVPAGHGSVGGHGGHGGQA